MRRLFLDLDGVIADFDLAYSDLFGHRPDRTRKDPPGMWSGIKSHGSFYRDMKLMPDAMELWNFAKKHHPIILTGVPDNMPEAGPQKRAMVTQNLGVNVPVITCKSRDKCLHAKPGDVLVDDWQKYKQLWIDKGGVWITHLSADGSIAQLRSLGFG